MLLKEQSRLENIIKKVKMDLEGAPEGKLRIGSSNGYPQYYLCGKDKSHNGVYLSKKEIKLAGELAQKSYNEKVLNYSMKAYNRISRLLKNYEDDKIEKIYMSENREKQKLIVPIEETYDQKLERWMLLSYKGKSFASDVPVLLSNNGLRVRSKSEKIMADYFDSIGLAFKYEYPLYLNSYGVIYPDFTFLSRRTGEEIYWEHEGMLDNPEYAVSAVKKIELYEKNGIFPGERLILTFESSATVFNSKIMMELTKRYLL
ncbi:MAG: hypothetical protein K6E98_08895 [Lachnospiraceae bacterium]|nr:hypothetical protein [Lachnospiraceae bacterium]